MSNWDAEDERWMRRALELAAEGTGWTNPNPLVGAAVVKDGRLLGEGLHRRYGAAHAERDALERAGDARGATLYVNWEPCVAFPGKRTPPCADLLVEAGIARVVVAALDPHPDVSGRGVRRLRAAGVNVEVGLLEAESRRLNEVSQVFYGRGRPFVCLKWAMTLDGRIATYQGHSHWVSGEASRARVHALRHRYAAVLVGVESALRDDPQLTVRHVDGRDPWRIVLDSRGRTPPGARLFERAGEVPAVVATTEAAPETFERAVEARGGCVWRLPARDGRVDLAALLDKLAEARVDSVLVEGGGEVHWSFLEQASFDKVVCFVAPKLVGGRGAPAPVGGRGRAAMDGATRLADVSIERLGDDTVITGYPEEAT